MSIHASCSQCQRALTVADHLAGKKVKCPQCGAVVVLPSAAGAAPASLSAPASSAAPPPKPAPVATPQATPPKATPVLHTRRPGPPVAPPSSAPPSRATTPPARVAKAASVAPVASVAAVAVAPPQETAFALETAAPSHPVRRSGSAGRGRGKNRPPFALPVWAYFVAGGVLLLGVLGAALFQNQDAKPVASAAKPKPVAAPRAERKASQSAAQPTIDFASLESLVPGKKREPPKKPGEGALLQDVYSYIEHGIVLIEVFDESDNKLGIGSGFVISAGGMVATNYHVVQAGYRAEAVFHQGERVPIEGYAGLERSDDLAILKLASTPSDMVVLDITYKGTPRKLEEVVAIGHPHNHQFTPFTGRVNAVRQTSEMDEDSQDFLRYLGSESDHTWIEHRTGIAPGNSGGPLIDMQGRVLGVNTWVNQELETGYALHIEHVRLLRNALFPDVEPLSKYRVGGSRIARSAQLEITLDQLNTLYAACEAIDWQPQSNQDYRQLQQLAWAMTYSLFAHESADPGDPNSDVYEELAARSREIIAEISEIDFREYTFVDEVNQYAARAVHTPLAGAFLFATVEKTVQGGDGKAGVILGLTGGDTKLFIPLEAGGAALDAGERCLILGMNYTTIPYGDNPLSGQRAHIILSKAIFRLGGE